MTGVTATTVLNLLLYQGGWFACILGAAQGRYLEGTALALLFLVAHLALCRERGRELFMVTAALLFGILLESFQQEAGLIAYSSPLGWPDNLIPPWMLLVWAQFATLFHFSLHWLQGRYLLGALLGGMGGPLAYLGGTELGAARFTAEPLLVLSVLAAAWALITPALLYLAGRSRIRSRCYRDFLS